jgi:flagellar biosynthetic protein FlhB
VVLSAEEQDSKTEAPSAKRLSEAHSKGQFARAPELTLVFTLAAALFTFGLAAREASDKMMRLAVVIFGRLGELRVQGDEVPAVAELAMTTFVSIALPVVLATALAAILAGGVQSGFQLTPEAMQPNFERFNPIAGLGRIFGKKIWVTAALDLLKVIAVFACLAAATSKIFSDVIFSAPVELLYLANFLHTSAMSLMWRFLGAIAVIAAMSYAYELYQSNQELMMSRQEVKDEHKQSDGNPLVKAAMRRFARRLLQKQMMDAVPTADVIVANPTHFAVALRYERGTDAAPVIVAKGENRHALRIKELGALHGVPIVENRPVARLLYATGKVGEPIPQDMFEAVAEILAFVYRTYRYYYFTLPSRRAAALSS